MSAGLLPGNIPGQAAHTRVKTIHKKTGPDRFNDLDQTIQYLVQLWQTATKCVIFPAPDGGNYLVIQS